MNVTNYVWQVLQYHSPLGVWKTLSERLEVMSTTAGYVDDQRSAIVFFGSSQHVVFYRKPLNPAWSAASVACHVGIEVLHYIARKGRPVIKTWEIGLEDVLQRSGSSAGGRPVSIAFEPCG